VRRGLVFGIFETQLLRTYLSSDDGKLVSRLLEKWEILFVTNRDVFPHLSKLLLDLNLSAKIEVIDAKKIPLIPRVARFILRWLEPSSGTLFAIESGKANRTFGPFGYSLRLLLYRMGSGFHWLKPIFKTIFTFSFSLRSLSDFGFLKKYSASFITSLTDDEFDLILAVASKKHGLGTVATVRSWDNTTTKGVIPFEPDFFISHSPFMTRTLIDNQAIGASKIIEICCPAYQSAYRPKTQRLSTRDPKLVGYACMGASIKPDESSFLHWFSDLSQELNFELIIIEHPKYRIENPIPSYNLTVLDYPTSTLAALYETLSRFDVVVGGGTTLLLDSLFSGVNVVAVGFELQTQPFWSSAMRWHDTLQHTQSFFSESGIPIARSKEELIAELSKYLSSSVNTNKSDNFNFKLFTGDFTKDFSNELASILERL